MTELKTFKEFISESDGVNYTIYGKKGTYNNVSYKLNNGVFKVTHQGKPVIELTGTSIKSGSGDFQIEISTEGSGSAQLKVVSTNDPFLGNEYKLTNGSKTIASFNVI